MNKRFRHDVEILRRSRAVIGDPAEWRRKAARPAWAIEMLDAWTEAQRAMDERCDEAVEWMDEAEFERLCDAEQAKVDAIRKAMTDAADHDRWPRHLYFGGL